MKSGRQGLICGGHELHLQPRERQQPLQDQRRLSQLCWHPYLACGIVQALPCQKLLVHCPNLADYGCQDRWFTQYAVARYGSWSGAKAFWLRNRWW